MVVFALNFEVVAPKEIRGKRRIIKSFRVRPHATDPELLCPFECFKAVRDHPALIFRPPGSTYSSSPTTFTNRCPHLLCLVGYIVNSLPYVLLTPMFL